MMMTSITTAVATCPAPSSRRHGRVVNARWQQTLARDSRSHVVTNPANMADANPLRVCCRGAHLRCHAGKKGGNFFDEMLDVMEGG